MTLNDTSIHLIIDSGNFQGFMLTRKQSEDPEQYDQWRPLTLEEAYALEAPLLMLANRLLETRK